MVIGFCIRNFVAFAEIKNPDTSVYLHIGEPDTLDPGYAYDNASGEVLTYIYENPFLMME